MQYSSFIEHIAGNRTKIQILRIFYQFPEKMWTARELAKYIRTYHTTVLDNLLDLMDFGIVKIGMHGHGKVLQVNKKNFIFKEMLCPLFEKEKRSREELISSLKELVIEKETKLCVLYGSIAEQKEKPNSDIDLLIVTSQKEKAEERIMKKQSEIVERFGNELSVTLWNIEDFKKKKYSPFIQTAKKKSIIIYGDWNEDS